MKLWARLLHGIGQWFYSACRPITIGARVILVSGGAALLVKHTYLEQWYLPGGGVRKGETVEEAARREASEEIGASLGRLRLLGVYTNLREHRSDHVAVFVCDEFALTGEGARRSVTGASLACAVPPSRRREGGQGVRSQRWTWRVPGP